LKNDYFDGDIVSFASKFVIPRPHPLPLPQDVKCSAFLFFFLATRVFFPHAKTFEARTISKASVVKALQKFIEFEFEGLSIVE
jgi:hypothetical protein